MSTLVGDRIIPNISCWPLNIQNNPLFLCDTDVTADVSIQRVRGLAFVFYFDDPFVQHIQGMANTYLVSSFFNSIELSISHIRSFLSFPSLYVENSLPSCLPSILFWQLLGVKQKIQQLLNTRSLSARCNLSCNINNIDPLTWHYISSNLPVHLQARRVVIKKTSVCRDEFVVDKSRAVQFSIELTLPAHLPMAQNVFGSAVGLVGTHNITWSLQ